MTYKELLLFVLFLLLPICKGAIPGTFFWRPRLGIDLAIPTTEPPIAAFQPNKANIRAGIVVLIEGYDIMTSMLGLLSGIQYASDDETMNPASGLYYTGVYRWTLRALNLFPHWLRGNFHNALSVWNNRFKYMDAEVPVWLRKAFPWVPVKSWDREKGDLEKFRKFSETAFTQFYRFPSKVFNDFNSFIPDSIEEFVFSSADRDDSGLSEESLESKKRREEALHKQMQSTNTAKKDNETDNKNINNVQETRKKFDRVKLPLNRAFS